jgi:hypothetical protein
MKSFFAIALFGAVSAANPHETTFMNYITQYGKSYKSVDEYKGRLGLFMIIDK